MPLQEPEAQDITDALGLRLSEIIEKGATVIAILLLAWIGYRGLKALTGRLRRRLDEDDGDAPSELEQRAKTLVELVNSIGATAIAITAILMILNLFISIGPILAGIGVLGLAISFGAQNLVRDIISGFFVVFENQFVIGDIVEINGKSGVVERMTLRIVGVRDLEGVLHIIPNGGITSVSNKTRVWARVVVDVPVGYKEQIDHILEVMRSLCTELWNDPEWQPLLTAAPEVLGLQSFGENSMNIRVTIETEAGRQWAVKRELLRRIKNRFDRDRIEIPFPQLTVHVSRPDSRDV